MTKTKSQKARAKQAKSRDFVAVPVGSTKKGKKWEFNLIKTGNNNFAYESGNSLGMRSRNAPVGTSAPRVRTNLSEQPGRMDKPIVQDEFVAIVNGSLTFAVNSYTVQPGLSSTFPWLSKVAQLYERYRVENIEFYYKPRVSAFAVAGQSGKVMMACDYDVLEAAPSTIQEMETMDPHADCMPYEQLLLKLNPSRCTPAAGKFVRARNVPGADLKTYDGGLLYIATAGMQDTNVCGELRVRYTLTLMNPRLTEVKAKPCNCISEFILPPDTDFPAALGGSLTGWTLPTASTSVKNPLGIVQTSGLFSLQAGTYIVRFEGAYYAPNMFTANFLLNFYIGGTLVAQHITQTGTSGATSANIVSFSLTKVIVVPDEDLTFTIQTSNTVPAGAFPVKSHGSQWLTFHLV